MPFLNSDALYKDYNIHEMLAHAPLAAAASCYFTSGYSSSSISKES